jgi:3-oxoacyl-[acyl-carrier-protein] synthase-1
LDEQILDEIEWRLNLPHHLQSAVIAMGNVSGLVALAQAREMIDRRISRYCVVAGVDSFLQQEVVEAYMDQRRIMTKTNSNGFFPGEAGAAVLVGASGSGKNGELRVLGMGFGNEPATITSDSPMRGAGMTEACRSALGEAGIAMHETGCRNTDLNGEHYKFKEAMFARNRLLKKRAPRREVWHAAECIGEVGAAHAPCALGTSLYSKEKNFAPGPWTLCHFSGDGPDRAACVVEVI